ncbi:hypothetical protein ACFWIA_34905 [Streptomyces sp. NPDC127068]|uniref:hypothetical protein n=1 Tax=Streptomyces sp. NPDC127068 TaxID=3347127 RepID=UPI00364E09F8
MYDEEFDSEEPEKLMNHDLERLGAEIAVQGLASTVTLPKSAKAEGLFQLTTSTADEGLIVTRLGAETVRLLPVFDHGDGVRWLDE